MNLIKQGSLMDLQGLRVLARGQSWSRNAQWMKDSQGPQEQWNHERRKSRLRWLVGRPDNEGLSHVICLANRILAGMMSSGFGKHLSGWVSPLLSLPPLGKGMTQLAHWFQVLEDTWNRAPPGGAQLRSSLPQAWQGAPLRSAELPHVIAQANPQIWQNKSLLF